MELENALDDLDQLEISLLWDREIYLGLKLRSSWRIQRDQQPDSRRVKE